MTSSDLYAANSFVNISPIKFTENGLRLLEEAKAQVLFVKKTKKLAKHFPPKMWKLKATNSVPSVCLFLSTAGDMFEKCPELQNYILFQDLQTMVCENFGTKNADVDPKLMSFYRYLRGLNPRAI